MNKKSFNFPTFLILVAAFAAGTGLWLSGQFFTSSQTPQLSSALLYPQPREIPEFHLIQPDGTAYSKDSWRGHWSILFFGFTHCPDICPVSLDVFKKVHKELDKAGISTQVRFDFISVDPERDQSEQLKNYVSFFNPEFRAATGPHEELTKLTRALGAVYSRTEEKNGKVQVDHSASAMIINPDGKLIGMFRPPLNPSAIVNDLQKLIQKNSKK